MIMFLSDIVLPYLVPSTPPAFLETEASREFLVSLFYPVMITGVVIFVLLKLYFKWLELRALQTFIKANKKPRRWWFK